MKARLRPLIFPSSDCRRRNRGWVFVLPLVLLIPALFHSAKAQTLYDFGFTRAPHLVVTTAKDTLSMPWAGGMNAVRFSEIDLNLDGSLDIIAFEKHGNRILPFLRQGDRLVFAPQYIHRFPKLHDWAIFHDYNQDGKADIFTYGLAGITVYKNISQDTLAFELLTDQLTAQYYDGPVNIYASPDDYPVIADVDGDGHTDILNFWVLGKYVHFLRNHSTVPDISTCAWRTNVGDILPKPPTTTPSHCLQIATTSLATGPCAMWVLPCCCTTLTGTDSTTFWWATLTHRISFCSPTMGRPMKHA